MKLKKLPITRNKLKVIEQKLEVKADNSKTWFSWIQNKWAQFETWFHTSYLPGLKTRLTIYASVIGSTAATLQQYITGLPLEKFVSGQTIAISGLVLALLALWFRGMGERVEQRIEDN